MRQRLYVTASTPVVWARGLAFGLLLLLLTLFAGVLSALIPVLAGAFGVAAVATALGFLLSLPLLLVATLFVSAIFAGAAEYFLGISQANWVPFILAGFLAVRTVLETTFGAARLREARSAAPVGLALFAYPAILYLTVLLASSVANLIPGPQALAALKNYVLMWGVLVAFVAVPSLDRTSRLLWRSIVIVAALQLPVVLYQRFFIASRISNTASSLSFDAINGTFGGGLQGGRSGALAMFVCIAVGYLLIQWRERRLGGLPLLGLLLLLMPTLFIVEVKAVVFWLPAIAIIVFAAQIRRRPFLFVAGVLGSAVLVVSVIAAYRYSYYAPTGDRTISSFFTRDLAYMWDPDRFNPATREMGRISVLVHWWRESQFGTAAQWLFGHGAGASRGASTVAVGAVAAKYPFFIDISAAVMLLWDAGVVGFLAFVSILVIGAAEARRLKRLQQLPLALRVELEAAMLGLLLILSSVIYVRDPVDGTTVQFLSFFFLGLVAYSRRVALSKVSDRSSVNAGRAR